MLDDYYVVSMEEFSTPVRGKCVIAEVEDPDSINCVQFKMK